MKNHIVFFGIILVCTHGLYGMDDAKALSNQMMLSSREAFGNNWMFKNSINTQGLNRWDNAFYQGINYIQNYEKKANKKTRKVLDNYVSQLVNAHNELINGVRITYNSMFTEAARKSLSTNALRFSKQQQLRPMFDKISNDMLNLILQVYYPSRKSKSQKETAIYYIIDQFAQHIRNAAKMAAKSIDFLQ